MARLARAGYGVEAPSSFSGLSVIGVKVAANAVLAARGSDDDLILDRQGSHGHGIAFRVVTDLSVPKNVPGFRVERQQPAIERSRKNPIVEESYPAVRASNCVDPFGQSVDVGPEPAAGLGVERYDIVVAFGQVHDGVNNQRRRL